MRVRPLPAPGGGVMPCFFKHVTSAVRLADEPLVDDADVEVVPELLVELLPQAASARLVTIAASAGVSRSARRRVLLGDFTCVLSWWY